MTGWQLSWRIVLTRDWGWPGERVQVLSATTVRELREVVQRARADPSIVRYRFWRHREWTGPDPPHDCGGSGDGQYVPAGITDVACCCGQGHRVYRCHRCGAEEIHPELGTGCGPIPAEGPYGARRDWLGR